MKILFLSPTVPFPLTDGGRIRVFNLLKQVSRKCEVTLLALETLPTDAESIAHLERFGIQVHLVRHGGELPPVSLGTILSAFLRRVPITVARYNVPAYRQKFKELVATETFDLVHYEMFHVAQFHTETDLPSLLSQQNVDSAIWRRLCQETANPLRKCLYWTQQRAFERYERLINPKFDIVTCASEIDKQAFQRTSAESRFEIIPNGVDIEDYQPDSTPVGATSGLNAIGQTSGLNAIDETSRSQHPIGETSRSRFDAQESHLIYIGSMDWYPNEDAVTFFADEVLPRIHEKLPNVQFSAVGGNPSARVQKLAANPQIQVTGRVPEIKPYFARATVFVVPLRIGSGTRLKILEALAMGKAVVSTTVGAEGLDLGIGEEILIADEPKAFAEAVLRLLTDASLRRRLGEKGRARVERDYDWRSIGEKLLRLYESLC